MINFAFDGALSIDDNGNMVIPFPNSYSKELYWFDVNKIVEKYGTFPIDDKIIEKDDSLLLNGRSICFNLNEDLYQYKKDTIDNFILNNESFVYSILIWNNDLFDGKINLTISDKVKEQIRIGKCKFVLFYITEPWFMYEYCYKWLSDFAELNQLTKSDFIFVSSNLIAPEIKEKYINEGVIKDNFKIVEFNYFFHRLWFFKHNFHRDFSKKLYEDTLNENLRKQKETKKEKHFLCFNRKPHDHRVAIFAELMTNPKLVNKSIVTLGREELIGGQNFKHAVRRFVDEKYSHGYERIHSFIDNYDGSVDYDYDTESLEHEQSIHINLDAHHRTFCNIVTETITAPDVVFMSEKIIKPIFTLQPFVLIGNKNTLKKLKEYGFKTFDRWWDESYDDADYQNRFEKIVTLLEEISSWNEEKITKTLEEMEEVLIHNFKMIVEDKSTIDFFNKFNKAIDDRKII
jgi:hypothetical protein